VALLLAMQLPASTQEWATGHQSAAHVAAMILVALSGMLVELQLNCCNCLFSRPGKVHP
jgi:hypothetical protein